MILAKSKMINLAATIGYSDHEKYHFVLYLAFWKEKILQNALIILHLKAYNTL
jgi:hypothetical protein